VIFPVGQRLDYSWPLVAQLLDGKSFLALAGLLLAGVALWRLRFWSPRTLFALAWIALSLAVESSFLPLEPLYEHRLYLPMLGVAMLFIDGAILRLRPGWQLPTVLVLLVALSLLTWQRNALWADPIAFWSDNQTKVPYSGRVMSNLAKTYADRGDFANAQQWYAAALRANPADGMSMAGLGNALLRQNKPEEARPLLLAALNNLKARPVEMCSAAGALFAVGERPVAMGLFQQALTLDSDNLLCLHNAAVAFARSGRPAEAEACYRRGLALEPDNGEFLLGLGVLRLESGAYAEALDHLGAALRRSPDDAKVLYFGAIAACLAGDAALCRDYGTRLQMRDLARYNKFEARINSSPSR
jgi:tetratricopeptide (TPR) repeat protein